MLFNLVRYLGYTAQQLFRCFVPWPGVRLFWKLWGARAHTEAEVIPARKLNKDTLQLYRLMCWLGWNGRGLMHWPFSLAVYKLLFDLLDNSTNTEL